MRALRGRVIFNGVILYKILKYVGKITYSIYLIHQVLIIELYSILFLIDNILINITLIIVSTIISALIVEKMTNKVNLIIGKRRSTKLCNSEI